MKIWGILLSAMLLGPLTLAAAPVEITVAKRGKDAVEARELAIAEAEKRGFLRLMEQRMPAKAEQIVNAYDPAQISTMVQSYEILDERMTDKSYRATLRLQFNQSIIDQILSRAEQIAAQAEQQAPLAETADGGAVPMEKEATLILPAFRNESGIMLWDEANKWRDFVNNSAVSASHKLVMPFGDPTDRLMIDSGNVTNASYGLLEPLAKRYGAQSVVVAIAESVYGSNPARVNVTIRHLTPESMTEQRMILQDKTVGHALRAGAGKLVNYILEARERRIEQATTIPLMEVDARMDFSSMRDWEAAKRRLRQIPAMEGIKIHKADWDGMDFALAFRGDAEQLGRELNRVNLKVEKLEEKLRLRLR